MIKTNDLRQGNKLLVDGRIWTVDSIIDISHPELYFVENDQYDHLINAEPIPLTPEILEKLTYPDFTQYRILYNKEAFKEYGNAVYWMQSTDGDFAKQVTTLNQAQNLFYALTDQELEVNL